MDAKDKVDIVMKEPLVVLMYKYNMYALKLMACLTDANLRFRIAAWKESGLHLDSVNEDSKIILKAFPKYARYITRLTGHEFQQTYFKDVGQMRCIYLAKTPMSTILNMLNNQKYSPSDDKLNLAWIKDITRGCIGDYLQLLIREERYTDTDTKPHEDITTFTKLMKFLNSNDVKQNGVANINTDSVQNLIQSVNKNFEISLQYNPNGLKTLTFGELKYDIFNSIEKRIEGNAKDYLRTRTQKLHIGLPRTR